MSLDAVKLYKQFNCDQYMNKVFTHLSPLNVINIYHLSNQSAKFEIDKSQLRIPSQTKY